MQTTGYDTGIANSPPKISAIDRVFKAALIQLDLLPTEAPKAFSSLPECSWKYEDKIVEIAEANNIHLTAYESWPEYAKRKDEYGPYYRNTHDPYRAAWLKKNKNVVSYLNQQMPDDDEIARIPFGGVKPYQNTHLDSCGVATNQLLYTASRPARIGSVKFFTVYANSFRNTSPYNLPELLWKDYQGNLVRVVKQEMEKGEWRCFDVLHYKSKPHTCSGMLQMGFTNSLKMWRKMKSL